MIGSYMCLRPKHQTRYSVGSQRHDAALSNTSRRFEMQFAELIIVLQVKIKFSSTCRVFTLDE